MLFRTSALALMVAGYQCAPQTVVAHDLRDKFGEMVVAAEESPDGEWVLESWEGWDSWTVTATDSGGLTCVIAAGKVKRA